MSHPSPGLSSHLEAAPVQAGTGAGARSAPASGPKLVLRTLIDRPPASWMLSERPRGPHLEVSLKRFANGATELVAYRADLALRGRKFSLKVEADGPDFDAAVNRVRSEMSELNFKRSAARSRRELRHRVLSMRADRMLTLTYRENKVELKDCWQDLGRFNRLMCKRFPGFEYVCAPERQQRGAWHFHLSVKGFYNVRIVRFLWRCAVCGDGKKEVGAINITAPRTGAQWNTAKLARYLSKYMTKAAHVSALGARRYSSSHLIAKPEKKTFFMILSDSNFYHLAKTLELYSHAGLQKSFEAGGPLGLIWMADY